MIITPIPLDIDLTAEVDGHTRSEGVHMSAIYGDMFKELEPYRYKGDLDTKQRDAYMAMGLALERMVEKGLKERHAHRPNEFRTKEGIAFSPDLLIFNSHTRVGEIKLTWMSSKDVPRKAGINVFPPKFQKYFVQMMSYAHALELNHARLYTYFVNGDYFKGTNSPMKPEFLSWDIEFTGRELRENYDRLMAHARHMKVI